MKAYWIFCLLVALLAIPSTGRSADPPENPLSGKPVETLASLLRESPDETVRLHAVKAIAADVATKVRTTPRPSKVKPTYVDADPKVVTILIGGLDDKASSVRYACREALGRCGAGAVVPLTAALASKNDDVRDNAAAAIGDIGVYDDADSMPLEQAVPGLTKLLDDKNYAVRVSAAMALSRIGARSGPAIDKLIGLLADEEWAVADAAVQAVAAADPTGRRSVPALAKALTGKHDLREFICVELGAMGAKAEHAVPALIKLLDTDRNSWQAGKAAANALTDIVSVPDKSTNAPSVSAETRTIAIAAVAKSAADPAKVPFVRDGRLFALLPKAPGARGDGYAGPLGTEALPALPLAMERLAQWTVPYRHWVPRRQLVDFIAAVGPQAPNKAEIIKIVEDLLANKELAAGVDERKQAGVRKELETLLTKLQAE